MHSHPSHFLEQLDSDVSVDTHRTGPLSEKSDSELVIRLVVCGMKKKIITFEFTPADYSWHEVRVCTVFIVCIV